MVARPPQKYVVAAAFVAAMFLNILDSTIVDVALPSIADAFGAEATQAEWVITVAALVAVELRNREPLLHLRLFGDRLFRATNLACFFGFGAFLGMLFTASLFVQSGQGLSPLDAGLTTFPEAVGVLAGSQVAARLYHEVGPRRLMTGGLILLSSMLLVLSTLGFDTSLWTLRGLLFVGGTGMGFVFLPLQAATFARITQSDMGQASASTTRSARRRAPRAWRSSPR